MAYRDENRCEKQQQGAYQHDLEVRLAGVGEKGDHGGRHAGSVGNLSITAATEGRAVRLVRLPSCR